MSNPGLILAALALGLVTGCGSSGPVATATPRAAPSPAASPTAPSARPATGPRITGTGYRLRVPQGWRDVTSRLNGDSGIDRAIGAIKPVNGFRSNFNVVVTDGSLTEKQLPAVLDNIREQMLPTAPKYTVLAPTLVAGSHTGHLAGLRSGVNKPYWIDQYVITGDDHCYILSFSFSPKVTPTRRQHTIDSILTTWSWAG